MGYIEDLRKKIGHMPVILVRPTVVVMNNKNELLLVQYKDGRWSIPGGLMELGESAEETAKRELKEEIGIEVGELELLDVYSGEGAFTKLKNGDQYYNVIITYIAREYTGELRPDLVEVKNAAFFDMNKLPEGTIPLIIQSMMMYRNKLIQKTLHAKE